MANAAASEWATGMAFVLQNFHILLDKAEDLTAPVPGNQFTVYYNRKYQLVCSMFFYTTRILSEAMKEVMKSNGSAPLCNVLRDIHHLQQVILQVDIGQQNFFRDLNLLFWDNVYCPNPLVLFLKLALNSRTPPTNMSDIQELLSNLGLHRHTASTRNFTRRYTPGMPNCVMALQIPGVEHTITATKDIYAAPELEKASKRHWEEQLRWVQSFCTSPNQFNLITNLEDLSREFMAAAGSDGVQNDRGEVNIDHPNMISFVQGRQNHATQRQIVLTDSNNGSVLATWSADGTSKKACLLDSYRFQTHRPAFNQGRMNLVFGEKCCAEWFGFVELVSFNRPITERPLPLTL